MQKNQNSKRIKSAVRMSSAAQIDALTERSGRYPNRALLFALTNLFIENPAPAPWEVAQFQELMLNLLPTADTSTRLELTRLLSQDERTPSRVLDALSPIAERGLPIDENALDPKPQVATTRQQPVYHIDQLKEMLPLQISKKMAHVAALAAKRGDRHVLTTILASNLTVPRHFAEFLLRNRDGLFLATALRALRMPATVAHSILLASENLESRDLIYIPQMVSSFERLDPEACRKRLKDWEKAFRSGNMPFVANSDKATLRPNDTKTIKNRARREVRHQIPIHLSSDHKLAS